MTRRGLNQDFFGPLIILALIGVSVSLSADQTGDCTSGTQYCEDNGLTTINTTVTTNTTPIIILIIILIPILIQIVILIIILM